MKKIGIMDPPEKQDSDESKYELAESFRRRIRALWLRIISLFMFGTTASFCLIGR